LICRQGGFHRVLKIPVEMHRKVIEEVQRTGSYSGERDFDRFFVSPCGVYHCSLGHWVKYCDDN